MQNNYNNFGLWFLSMKFSSVRIFKSAYVCCVQLRYTFPRLMLLQEPLLIIAAFYLLFLLVIIYVRLDFAISKVLLPAQQYNNAHLTALCLGLPRWASTSKVKPIWIILKQETVSGSGISWTIYKSAPRYRHRLRSEVMINWLQSVKSELTGEKRSTVMRIREKAGFTPGIKEWGTSERYYT